MIFDRILQDLRINGIWEGVYLGGGVVLGRGVCVWRAWAIWLVSQR